MGMPLARNLLAAGMPTTVWNRTRSKAEPLAADGAHLADSVAEAAADVVLSVLPDVPQLRSLLDEEALAAQIGRHTSELQSRGHLVCRLLLEKKKSTTIPCFFRG